MTKINSIDTNSSGIVQVVIATTSGVVVCPGTSLMPCFDGSVVGSNDYLPQITDGTEILSHIFTPRFASSNIYIEASVNSNLIFDPTDFSVLSLFNSNSTNALATTCSLMGYFGNMVLIYQEIASSTATRTYSLRMGPSTAMNPSINGSTVNTWFGGIESSNMIIYEVGT